MPRSDANAGVLIEKAALPATNLYQIHFPANYTEAYHCALVIYADSAIYTNR